MHVVCMARGEERMTRHSPFDMPNEWRRSKSGLRPCIFQFSQTKTSLPPLLPLEEDEEKDQKKEKKVTMKVWGGMSRRYWNINLEDMLEAGVHFGHATQKWNPRMAPYISAKRKGIHIINLIRTARFLSEACDLVFDAASKGKEFLFVGTKLKAADIVAHAAIKARCHYVNKKWLGGMLTNWDTTETRLLKFRDLIMNQKTGRFGRLKKRDAATMKRQLARLHTYLGGIQYMTKLPDIVVIVDQNEEYIALRECEILGIPTICLIDTNCDPDLADIPIPANDDAIASIRAILDKLVYAICEGRSRIRNL